MNYQETCSYLDHLPVFIPRKPAPGEELFNLDNIRILLKRLGNPEAKVPMVHVAGSNGKGSVCAYLTQILTESGLKTGFFSSPAITTRRDMIRIGNEIISRDDYARIISRIRSHAEAMEAAGEGSPSEFEIVTACAFTYFYENACRIAVIETGMGGRLDATNIIPAPALAVITPVSLEHTQVLGDTLSQIAGEKAGILKAGSRLLLCPQPEEAESVFLRTADALSIPVFRVPEAASVSFDDRGQDFVIEGMSEKFHTTLPAPYQIANAATAVKAALLLGQNGPAIPASALTEGVRKTSWPGRFEIVRRNPCVIVDGSHNPAGVKMLITSLDHLFPEKKIIFITGFLKDKNHDEMISDLLPRAKCFFTIDVPSPRTLPASVLAEEIAGHGGTAVPMNSISEAAVAALHEADPSDVICACGSLYSVGVLRRFFL